MQRLWLVMGLVVACGGGDDERHPAAPQQGGASPTAGSGPRAGSASTPDAGQAGQAELLGGAGGAGGEGGAAGELPIIYEMGGKPQNMPGVCDPEMVLGEAQDVGVSGATLLSMSNDELSVVFTTGVDESVALHVGDRTSVDADFSEQTVSLPSGYLASRGLALSGDGRRLVIVREDSSGFAELSRSSRGAAFGVEPDETRFAKINALEPMSGESVGWPVLSSDGQTLYFVSYVRQAWVRQSKLEAGVFDIGEPIDEFTLGGAMGEHKLLSGISADQRAIFFFDQATSHAMALFRSRPDAPFYEPLDLGERRGAAPNEDCSRIYSSLGSGIVFQTTE